MNVELSSSYVGHGNGQQLSDYPTPEQVRDIEEMGFVQEAVQAYLDRLDRGTPSEVRSAAMLRGGFNELLRKTEEQESAS